MENKISLKTQKTRGNDPKWHEKINMLTVFVDNGNITILNKKNEIEIRISKDGRAIYFSSFEDFFKQLEK